ncbi:hypothetical protein [Psychrobacter phenylpyruvicus]|uniref:Uncharacterized protein n=2 Tax=Psychrobacter phenylpyruvicus TaxID=29432 RepID=A0A379LIN4_9GAMM|nr:hypothetical protein [Psychrobacter phenylpyruvicus]SUD90413.1 Uncharacterised protein [Psychrobacter phenylpyruvicus]
MVMAINNAALLTQPTDISNLSSSFRDGQKLRQEYESRQQQKALNDIMRISGEDETDTFAQQLAAARQHKYAGALVPAVQQYEEARQKAALDNLKTSADIRKTFGETGKLNAETGKISGEAEEIQLKNAQGIKDYISAAAVTQDPKVFGLHIGELYKRGLITESQTQSLLKMIVADPANAAKVMQAMAMGDREIAKTFMPEFKTADGGDKIYGYSVNKFTGEADGPSLTITKGTSPDVVHQGGVSERNNIRTTEATRYASDNSLKGTVYSADSTAETKYAQMEWERQQEEIKSNQAKYETFGDEVYVVYSNGTARRAVDENGKPISAKKSTAGGATGKGLESDERKKLIEIEENNNSTKQAIASLKKMQALAGDDETYSGFAASQRAAVASNLGIGGKQADNTVLYDSLATGQALEQLRSVFGGNPTEGERKILLEIQASSNKTPAQKKAILNNAIKMAEARIASNNKTAQRIRTGEYATTAAQGSSATGGGSYKTNKGHGRKGNTGGNKTSNKDAEIEAIANKWFN